MFRPALLAAIALSMGATAAQACSYDAGRDSLSTRPGATYAGAEGRDWFAAGALIVLDGDRYQKYGPPREFDDFDLESLGKAGAWKGVTLFTDVEGDAKVIYAPVNAARCTFQIYQRMD